MGEHPGHRPPVHKRGPCEFDPGETLPAWFACDRLLDHRGLIAREGHAYCATCGDAVPFADVIDRRTGEVSASAPAFL